LSRRMRRSGKVSRCTIGGTFRCTFRSLLPVVGREERSIVRTGHASSFFRWMGRGVDDRAPDEKEPPNDPAHGRPWLRGEMLAFLLALGGGAMTGQGCAQEPARNHGLQEEVRLPEPRTSGPVSVEEAIHGRRSVRNFRTDPIDLPQVSQLLWVAQGITDGNGLRAVPSAGATYPLETYLIVGEVQTLAPGVYRYAPERHALHLLQPGDLREEMATAALGQSWIADAPITILVAAVFSRTTGRYGDRGRQYVHMEMGHAAQNVYVQAEALGLGTTMVGAFHDQALAEAAGLPSEELPLGLLPVGVPR